MIQLEVNKINQINQTNQTQTSAGVERENQIASPGANRSTGNNIAISDEGRETFKNEHQSACESCFETGSEESKKTGKAQEEKKEKTLDGKELSEEDQKLLKELRSRDQEVKQHESAHLAAAGSLAKGGANFDYQVGPDGQRYAVGGHVNIDTSGGSTPQETIQKANRIKQAALAPASPSGQDQAVAARASAMAAQAQGELMALVQEKLEANSDSQAANYAKKAAGDAYQKQSVNQGSSPSTAHR